MRYDKKKNRLTAGRLTGVVIGAVALSGCVQIATPDKPIEINLNIKIQQEIALKLDGDAKKLIEQNGDIF